MFPSDKFKGTFENTKTYNNANNNLNTNHPIISNSEENLYYKKYISIHSEDRDPLKFPLSSEFDIELPEDLLNVLSIRLTDWTFPANYNTFSIYNNNISMTFLINNPYDPTTNIINNLQYAIYECLFYTSQNNYRIVISEGFYNPVQMITELTNKFNEAVTNRIITYFNNIITNPSENKTGFDYTILLQEFTDSGGYNNFKIVYNNVGQKIWYGNTTDGFILTTSNTVIQQGLSNNLSCGIKEQLPDFSNWGLPGNLGLTRCDVDSIATSNINTARFYYGDVFTGDNGYWLLPNSSLPGSQIHYIESPFKINLMGPSHFYMELAGQNCIDETSPYNVSSFTLHTNTTNGRVNSAFAKIAVPAVPICQWFDKISLPYKIYTPPAERIRKLNIKLRYHNGLAVNFGNFDYSFTLEFILLIPTQSRRIFSYSNIAGFNQAYL